MQFAFGATTTWSRRERTTAAASSTSLGRPAPPVTAAIYYRGEEGTFTLARPEDGCADDG